MGLLKHFILSTSFVALCSLNPNKVQAQSWFPNGAEWTYHYQDMMLQMGYVTHLVTGDSVVEGRACKLLNVTRTTAWGTNVDTLNIGTYYLADSSGLISIRLPSGGFDTLYNMNAVPGDRWMLAPFQENCDSTAYLDVVDTGHVELNNQNLRWLAVHIRFPAIWGTYAFKDTIVERLGTLLSYLPPQNMCLGALDGSEGGALRCYEDGQISYMALGVDACRISLGITEAERQALEMFPNPGENAFRLKLPAALCGQLVIHDAQGREVLRAKLKEAAIDVSTGQWPSGLYSISVLSGNAVPLRGKWMKL